MSIRIAKFACVLVLTGCTSGPQASKNPAPSAKRIVDASSAESQSASMDNRFNRNEQSNTFFSQMMNLKDSVESKNRTLARLHGPSAIIDFDDLPPGANVEDYYFNGVEFVSHNAPLIVVRNKDVTVPEGYVSLENPSDYALTAGSGTQFLSPGGAVLAPGPNPSIEDDDITILFTPPVSSVAFELLHMSRDGLGFITITVFNAAGEILSREECGGYRDDADGWQYPPPGSDSIMYVSQRPEIARIDIEERDSDASCPDANIGIDTIYVNAALLTTDVNEDGIVWIDDLCAIIRIWQASLQPRDVLFKREDVNIDGVVDVDDVITALAQFGP